MSSQQRPERARILVIDDNAAIHADIRKILEGESDSDLDLRAMEAVLFDAGSPGPRLAYRLDAALSGQEGVAMAQQALKEGDPYVVAFVDMRMPTGWDGLVTIEHLWMFDPHVQTVICTAYTDHSWTDIRLRLGDTDRLLILKKPFDNMEISQFAAALTAKYYLAQMIRANVDMLEERVAQRTAELKRANEALQQEVRHRQAAEERLQYDATHDSLTGLANRLALVQSIDQAIKRGKRDPQYGFAVLFIDLDDFKIVNDSLGHDAGDALLREVADRLRVAAREVDTVARVVDAQSFRLGGDEFVVLLDGVGTTQEVEHVAQRLKERTAGALAVNGHELVANMSIGIAMGCSGYDSANEVLRDADTALYHAKSRGKNGCIVFDQQMHTAMRRRLELEEELRAALRNGHVDVYYQPIVCLVTGHLHGFEALARWKHPDLGWISPSQFMPVAELSGLVIPLGVFVLHRACGDLASWRAIDPRHRDLWVSINISPKQLHNHELADQVSYCVETYKLDPAAVRLEITETSVMEHRDAAQIALQKLRARQIALALDDFGTGYSSLIHLQELPISTVKIDRKFTGQLCLRGRAHAATVHAIIELAHNRDLKVVAEGVETADQLFQLQSLDCDFAQGYLFARPMPADEVRSRYLLPQSTPLFDHASLTRQAAQAASRADAQHATPDRA